MLKLRITLTLLVALSSLLSGMVGYALKQPEVIERVRYETVYIKKEPVWLPPVTQIKVVEKVVTETVVETAIETVYTPVIPQRFRNKAQVEEFLEYWRANKVIAFVASGETDLLSIQNNCIPMATTIQNMAAEQGYLFDTEVLTREEMFKLYHYWPDRPHMINKAVLMDNTAFYYDFETDKLWRAW